MRLAVGRAKAAKAGKEQTKNLKFKTKNGIASSNVSGFMLACAP